ncbi:YadA-like family protein [uncultured Cloacibacillus sp.]|uniref:YadA-like family protein n=1 Tax=uncultured Cloacibacillus sp. TaxID=889794 RepID=UPI0026DD5B62|nr:YadA-like family protein [uncultured Cloacibacillus sp.]
MIHAAKNRFFSKSLALAVIASLAMVTGASAAEPTATQLNDRITNVKETLEGKIADEDNKVRNEFKAADTQTNDRITKVRDILEDADKAISDRVTAAENSAASAHNRIDSVKEQYKKDIKAGDDAMRTEFEKANTNTNNRIDSVKEQYQEAIKTGDEALRTEFEKANTNTNNRIDSVKEQYKAEIAASDQAVREAFARADTQLDNRITNVRDTLRNEYNSEFSSLQDVLGSNYDTPTFSSMTMGGYTMRGTADGFDMGGARLSGLADGGVYRGSTDAVTGNQLWDVYRNMDDLREDINIVGAHAAALSGLHPIDYNPYEPTTLSAAIGTYRDEYAVAVGVFHYAKENVMFNLGASLCSDGDLMGRAGVSFTVGKSGKKQPLPPKDMNEMQAQLAQVQQALLELKASNDELKADNEELKADNEALKLMLEERN